MDKGRKNILITTQCDDVHAVSVGIALREMGHHPILWFAADFPELSKVAWGLSNEKPVLLSADHLEGTFTSNEIDCHWYRRPNSPVINKDVSDVEKKMAIRECRLFFNWLYESINVGFSVNPVRAAICGENKLKQLACARSCGLLIPDTIITNSPDEIRAFIERDALSTVYKPFRGAFWKDESGVFSKTLTSKVTEADLVADEYLRLTPGIFQKYVEKKYELRIVAMGNHVVAIKLDSQANTKTSEDWRGATVRASLKPEVVTIPEQIRSQCLELLKSMGLVFGCIDMIVTPDERYVFLENNQAGQFLWLEAINPDIRLLDPFLHFLISASDRYEYCPSGRIMKFEDIAQQCHEEILRLSRSHNVYYDRSEIFEKEVLTE